MKTKCGDTANVLPLIMFNYSKIQNPNDLLVYCTFLIGKIILLLLYYILYML